MTQEYPIGFASSASLVISGEAVFFVALGSGMGTYGPTEINSMGAIFRRPRYPRITQRRMMGCSRDEQTAPGRAPSDRGGCLPAAKRVVEVVAVVQQNSFTVCAVNEEPTTTASTGIKLCHP